VKLSKQQKALIQLLATDHSREDMAKKTGLSLNADVPPSLV
jgi:hypothetical protein